MTGSGAVRFTVFTPTYNRSATLHRVYESLKGQTVRDFEWLVVDDGSTDDTRSLVEQWQKAPETDFPVRYIWQENQHKKVAHNCAVREARGELFLVFDSDDRCVPETLERFWSHWQAIPEGKKTEFAAAWCLCQTEDGQIVGHRVLGGEWVDSDYLEMKYRYGIRGEMWGVMRTEVLRQFPFREDIPGYVPEGTVWGAIGGRYKTRFFNEALRIYMQDVPGVMRRPGATIDPAANAPGGAYAKQRVLTYEVGYLRYAPIWFLLEAARLLRFWLHMDCKQRRLIGLWPQSWLGKVLVVAGAPVGVFMWLRDRRLISGQRQSGA